MTQAVDANDDRIQKLTEQLEQGNVLAYCDVQLSGHPFPDVTALPPAENITTIQLETSNGQIPPFLAGRGIIDDKITKQSQEDGSIRYQMTLKEELVGKFKQEGLTEKLQLPISNERPIKLTKTKIPKNIQLALAHCRNQMNEDCGVLILRNRLPSNNEHLSNALMKSGLISKNPEKRRGYRFQSSDAEDGVVAAVMIPAALAELLRKGDGTKIRSLGEFVDDKDLKEKLANGDLDFKEVLNIAAAHLQPALEQNASNVVTLRRDPKDTAEPKEEPARALEDFKEELNTHFIAFEKRRRLDGSYDYFVWFNRQSQPLIDALATPEQCSEPLKMIPSTGEDENSRQYTINQDKYERLHALIKNPTYKEEKPATIPEKALRQERPRSGGSKAEAISLINVAPIAAGGAYVCVVADTKGRLERFLGELPASKEALNVEWATTANEQPAIARFAVAEPIAQDLRKQVFSSHIQENKLNYESEADTPSTTDQWKDKLRTDHAVKTIPPKESAAEKKIKARLRQYRLPTDEPPETGKPISYAKQQSSEDSFLEALKEALDKQAKKDDFLRAAFASVEHAHTPESWVAKTRKTLGACTWVEPLLCVQLSNSAYQAITGNKEYKDLISIQQLEQEGTGDNAIRTLNIRLSPDGMEKAKEKFSHIASINDGEGPIPVGALKPKVLQHFTEIKQQAEEARKLFELGLSKEDKSAYQNYLKWKDDPQNAPEELHEEIRNIKAKLAKYQEEQARERAYHAITSKEVLLANVVHLSNEEQHDIELKLERLNALQEALKNYQKPFDAMLGTTKELEKETQISQLGASLTESLGRTIHSAEQSIDSMEQTEACIAEINREFGEYKEWLTSVKGENSLKQIIVLRTTPKSKEQIKALSDSMSRPPVVLPNALGSGRDALLLFPTDEMLHEVEKRLRNQAVSQAIEQNLSDQEVEKCRNAHYPPLLSEENLRPSEIIGKISERYAPAPVHAKVKPKGPEFEAIANQLQQTLNSLTFELREEQQISPSHIYAATESIGQQKTLCFTVRTRKERRLVSEIAERLKEKEMLASFKTYGEEVDAAQYRQETEKQLEQALANLEKACEYFDDLSSRAQRLCTQHESEGVIALQEYQNLITLEKQSPEQLEAINSSITSLTSLFPKSNWSENLSNKPAQLTADSPSELQKHNNSLKTFKKKLNQLRNLAENACRQKRDDSAKSHNQKRIEVIDTGHSLLDKDGEPVTDIEAYHQDQKDAENIPYELKLYIKPEMYAAFEKRANEHSAKTAGHGR